MQCLTIDTKYNTLNKAPLWEPFYVPIKIPCSFICSINRYPFMSDLGHSIFKSQLMKKQKKKHSDKAKIKILINFVRKLLSKPLNTIVLGG